MSVDIFVVEFGEKVKCEEFSVAFISCGHGFSRVNLKERDLEVLIVERFITEGKRKEPEKAREEMK